MARTRASNLVGRVGLEPLTGGFEKHDPVHPALAAPFARVIALMALATLGFPDDPVHDPVHAGSPRHTYSVYCAYYPIRARL